MQDPFLDRSGKEISEPIDYVDVFAEELPDKKPLYTGWQMFRFGLILGVVLMAAFIFYVLPWPHREMPAGGLPVNPVHSTQ